MSARFSSYIIFLSDYFLFFMLELNREAAMVVDVFSGFCR